MKTRQDVHPGRVQIWQAVIGGAVAVVLAALQILNTYAITQASAAAATRGEKQAAAVVEVKTDLAVATKSADVKLNDIHTLVNSNMGRQLKVSAVALRRVATLTRDRDDVAAALEAEALLADHVKKQAAVDAGSGAVTTTGGR